MRLSCITLLFLIITPLASVSFADERSDCLNNCTNDKNINDSYCPPADENNSEEYKQCLDNNNATASACSSSCPPADLQPPPPLPAEEPVTSDKQ